MKKLTLHYSFCGSDQVRTAVINDDINRDEILASHPDNKDVSSEFQSGAELGIWSLFFNDADDSMLEFDFVATIGEDDVIHLTLDPIEVLLFDGNGAFVNKDTIPFSVELSDL